MKVISYLKLRKVGYEEVEKIEQLYKATYPTKTSPGISYWQWCYKNPYGYLNMGTFDGDTLVSYYACNLTKDSGGLVSAMTHPDYRKQGLYMKVTTALHERIPRDYVYLFSNERIRKIHIELEHYTEAYQIKEYKLPYELKKVRLDLGNPFYEDSYLNWRFNHHPLHQGKDAYIKFYYNTIYSTYEDKVQIINYDNLEQAIGIGMYIAKTLGKKYVSFLCEKELDYPYEMMDSWLHIKPLKEGLDINTIMKDFKLRMGIWDVF